MNIHALPLDSLSDNSPSPKQQGCVITHVSRTSHRFTFSMASAVFTGTVDFSTTILLLVDTDAIMRAAPSLHNVAMHTFSCV